MDIKNVVTTVAASVATVSSILLLKNKGGFSGDSAVTLVKNSSEAMETIPKTFAGVTEEEATRLAQSVSRGIKATISGNTLTYVYRSASGKTKNIAELTLKEGGEIVVTAFSKMNASSLHQFVHALTDLIKSKNNA